jgi:ATPase subunit of ABC transporter with duplicated ATPase domains
VQVGLFHQTSDLRGLHGRTPLEAVLGLGLTDQPARSALARYGLAGAADRNVTTLSGGQRARLQILILELEGANCLLLDEPTDNLDLLSAEALEAALEGFTGTVLAVTHDRWFMRSFDRYLLFDHDCTVHEELDLDAALRDLGALDTV